MKEGTDMHGGDIYRNKISYDFSVNVNPLGIPESVKEAFVNSLSDLTHYPDPENEALRRALAKKFDFPMEQILCGNGASELIMAICRSIDLEYGLVFSQSFTGYRHALKAVGAGIETFLLSQGQLNVKDIEAELRSRRADVFFVGNPNNPDGNLMQLSDLEKIAKVCDETETVFVIDECFIELTGKSKEYSFVESLREGKYPNVVVLRAFTKSFAIPGVRLGYALCGSIKIAKAIKKQLPEWNVSIPATAAGLKALEEDDFLNKAASVIAEEREYLLNELSGMGIYVLPTQANFILFRLFENQPYYDSLMEKLMEEEILIRDCRDYEGLEPGYYRIAVKCHEENQILVKAMEKIYE